MKKTVCPHCQGRGKTLGHHNTGLDSKKHYWAETRCSLCKGFGRVSASIAKTEQARIKKFNEFREKIMRLRGRRVVGMDLAREKGVSRSFIFKTPRGETIDLLDIDKMKEMVKGG